MSAVNRYTLPLATYDTLYAVLERMADVIGAPPKRSIFGKMTYTITDNGRTEIVSLTKKAINIKVIKNGRVIAKGNTRFPVNGVISISYGEPSSAIIVKDYDGILLLVILNGVSHDAIEYIANGKVTSKPVSPKPDIGKPYSFSIVKDANVPPMESFKDCGKPYVIPVREPKKPAPPAPKNPLSRWNNDIVKNAKGKKVEIYTDGGYRPEENGLGGWAFAIIHNENVAVMDAGTEKTASTSITRMELKAAAEALKALIRVNPFEAVVYTDNRYVQGGAEIWYKGWLNEDGTFKDGVKDADLWADLLNARNRLKEMKCNITFEWIKGHAGNKWNEYVDAKNKAAMDAYRK